MERAADEASRPTAPAARAAVFGPRNDAPSHLDARRSADVRRLMNDATVAEDLAIGLTSRVSARKSVGLAVQEIVDFAIESPRAADGHLVQP